MSHADDTTPDPLKLPPDDLNGTMSLDDGPAMAGTPEPGEPDLLSAEPEAAIEPTDAKGKKRAEKERKKREQEEKKRKAKEEKDAKARAKKEKKGKKKGEEEEPAEPAEGIETAEPAEEAPAGKKKPKKEKKEKKSRKKKPAATDLAEAKAVAKGPSLSLMSRISRASPYTVMLAVAFGSLAIAVSILVLYLSRYDFRIHP